MRTMIALTLALLISGCSRFDAGVQTYTSEELLEITKGYTACKVSSLVELYEVMTSGNENAYIALIKSEEEIVPIRMLKTHSTLGGYQLLGISIDGEYEVRGSINYLSATGLDIRIDSIEHYLTGSVTSDLYMYCKP